MSQIAGLQDFRQEGPPADIGTFQFPCSILVFRRTFAGTTYICAVRAGVRGWVLVDYGTVASTVVASALAALTAGRTWPETLVLTGNFTFTARVNVPSYTVIEVQGIITLANGVNDDIFRLTAVSNVEIYGGRLHGNQANQTAGVGINIIRCNDVTIHSIYFYDTWDAGVRIYGSGGTVNYIDVYHCRFEAISAEAAGQYAAGIEGDTNCYYVTISHNIFKNMNWIAMDCDGLHDSNIVGNIVYNSLNGIEVSEGSINVVVADNNVKTITRLSAGSAGLQIGTAGNPCQRIIIANNIIEDVQRDGIFLANSSVDCVVEGNIVYNAGRAAVAGANNGLRIRDANGCLICGNRLLGNNGYGIYLSGGSNNNRIEGNYTSGNTGGCVNVSAATCNNNVITNNNLDEGNIADAGTNTRAWLNYDPSANAFIATINPPAVVGGGGGNLP
jgi:parallel beta-helix repeat protein